MKRMLIHEIHDMWPATLVELGGMSTHNPFVWLLQRAENYACKRSDQVVSILPNNLEYLIEHGMKKEKYHYIPNGINIEEWNETKPIPDDMAKVLNNYHSENKYIVGYYGGHALSNALDILLDVAKSMLDDTSIMFVLVGNGAEKDSLVARSKNENIHNITFFDSVSKKCIPDLLTYFDCIYMGTRDSSLYRFGIGLNKAFDAMMSGKPVILSTNACNTVIDENNCGIVVPANDKLAIKDAVEKIKKYTEEELASIRHNGQSAVSGKYVYSKIAVDFEHIFGNKRGKRILIINHYAGSPEMGMEYRPYYLAKEWVKRGSKVRIIAADYSHLRIKNPDVRKDFEISIIDGIEYQWVKTSRYVGNGISRALTMFQFCMKVWMKAYNIVDDFSPDIIIDSSTYPLDSYVGNRIKNVR